MAKMEGTKPQPAGLDFPGVEDGIRGMPFIDLVVASGTDDTVKWVKWPE
jgi:hypothetical protein